MQRSKLAFTICLLTAAASVYAQSPYGRPLAVQNVGIDQKLDAQIPMDLKFTDETGQTVQLSQYFGQKPVVLALVYYTCPMLCDLILDGTESGLKRVTELSAGKDFNVLAVSFDPRDTPQLAAAKKHGIVSRYDRPTGEQGWHFLTGSAASSKALADAVGFHYSFDKTTGQYAHASAIMILTPEGKVSQYYYGIKYPERDLRLALVQASANKIGSLTDQVLLLCYHYDPSKGKYTLLVNNVLRAAGLSTVLALGVFLTVMVRRDRRTRDNGPGPSGPPAGRNA